MSLSRRVIVVALLAGIAGFLAAVATVLVLLARNNGATVSALRDQANDTDGLARCAADPARWTVELPGGARAFAYDPELLPAHPLAPALALPVERAPRAIGEVADLQRTVAHGPVIALRVQSRGACAIIAAAYPLRPQRHDPTAAGALGLALVTATITALGFVVVVRPFTRRVEQLRRAAERVGDEGYCASASAATSRDELGRISAALDAAHGRIQMANELVRRRLRGLEEHLADVAHDVRTPLASLQAKIEEALDASELDIARARLHAALRDCVYIAGITENLRLASRIEEGLDVREGHTNLTATVESVVQRLSFYARRREIALEHAVPEAALAVRCDPFAFERALTNVVENAITHLEAGNRIAVVLDRAGASGFSLVIVDDGPGVGATEIARLGERTFRTDAARARDPRGSGLGLAIARTVCERAGFAIAFEDAPEGGLRVTIHGAIESASLAVARDVS
jgi:signal transduction histidine kinase